jgi:hypothetical protein
MTQGSSAQTTGLIGWLPLALLPLGTVVLSGFVQPWVFMWILSISLYSGLKWLSWWKARSKIRPPAWRSVAYLLAWPGMDAESFLAVTKWVPLPRFKNWFWAVCETGFGVILFWVVARVVPQGEPLLRGWVGMLGLVLLLHFGTFQLVALSWQRFGVDAMPIMASPLRSKSLSEFWGKRWNLGFRQLSHDLIFDPLHKNLGVRTASLLVFVVSGAIHDLVISVPARGGYGLPTAYFVVQGLGVLVEHSFFGKQLGLRTGVRGWLFMATVTAGPAYFLFHPPFVLCVIIPFMKWAHAL